MDETIATYDDTAREFAERNWETPLDAMLGAFARFVPQGGRVLDLGCGPGRDVARLSARGFDVIGIDLSTGMLLEAQRRQVPSLGVACADMSALPVAPDVFDGIWASASLLHLPRADAPGALADMHRVLIGRGCLYLSVKLGEGEAWDTRFGRRFFTYYQPDELAELLNCAGFGIVELGVDQGDTTTWINVIALVR